MRIFFSSLCVAVLSLLFFSCEQKSGVVQQVPDKVDFNFDVRPILVQNCYLCHGPDPSSRKADLRLDTFEGATALLESGQRAIVPGDPDDSELVKRILHQDEGALMPPPESNLELSEYQIEVLKKWIEQGAEWKKHWAFIPSKQLEPPTGDKDFVNNEVDNFVLAKMESKGLKPSPQADKYSLIRRVSYILTGLPPTTEELNNYLADDTEDAYEKMVDYYLNSSAFGERWARHWMDIMRYAETKGHEFDYTIMGAWRYRDYLIRAFNEDVPYDQLVREHLAGDLIEEVRWNKETGINESQLATAFHTLGEGTHSPVDIRKDEADRIDNMIDVTSKSFQALTVSCSRCHDHKFDPIPTADYYAMYGVLESSRFSPKPAGLTYDKMKSAEEIQTLKNELRNMIAGEWKGTDIAFSASAQKAKSDTSFQVIGDFRGQDLDGWKSDGFAFGQQSTLGQPVFDDSGKRLVKLASGMASSRQLGTGIYGALRSPNIIIEKDYVGVRARGKDAVIRIIIDNFQLIQYPIYGGLTKKVKSDKWENFVFDLSSWKGHKAYIEILPGVFNKHVYHQSEDAYVEVEYALAYNGKWPKAHQLPVMEKMNTENAVESWQAANTTPYQVDALNRSIASGKVKRTFPDAAGIVSSIQGLSTELRDSTFFMGIVDGFGIDSHVFIRGSYQELSEEPVKRGFLTILADEGNSHRFDTPGSGRLNLVETILDEDNPLTSRVMVNRIWHHLFGRGIVETVDNFGLQGKLPSHPELLDYLAIKFQQEGWSIKKMIRYIVLSNTFRQSVEGSVKSKKIDPANALLTHFPLRRLESEAIWDGLLAAGGNLDRTMYGKPVPVHLTSFMQGRGRPGKSGPLDGEGRRSIYQEVRRNFLQPMMLTFDRPIPFSTFGKRNVTNVPAQSLILMNDPFISHQAELLANDVIAQKELDVAEKINYIYLKTLTRPATEEEITKASAFIESLAQTHDIEAAGIGENPVIWKDYCHSVFNLKEFIYLI